jgi:N-acetylglucosamine-6-phosphate deacetylase
MRKINVIKNGTVITPFRIIKSGVVVFEHGKITSVGSQSDVKTPKEARLIDASGKIVAPGFIDVHIHGGKGRDIMEGSYEAINEIAKFAASHGTTAFLPTTVSAPRDDLLKAVRAVKTAMERGTQGAEVLGVHLEGPYINPEKHGAHDAEHVRPSSPEEIKELLEAANRTVKIVTLAPEVNGSEELIKELVKLGIVVSVGHSNATYQEAIEAMKLGVTHAAHTFNGMRSFHHREPGIVGAVLVHDELTAELISDNIHMHPIAMKLLARTKGTDKVVLVTDAIQAAGMPDGKYKLGKQKVIVKKGVCKLESGELAGSTLTMNEAVRNTMKSVGIPLTTAIKMATINPAVAISVNKSKGSLEPGKDADIVIIDDKVNVYMTIVKEKVVYEA